MRNEMVEGRDIEGLSIPFVLGVSAGAVFMALVPYGPLHYLISFLVFLSLSAFILASVWMGRSGMVSRTAYPLLAVMGLTFLTTGFFCYMTDAIGTFDCSSSPGPIRRAADVSLMKLESVIESIPYPTSYTGGMVKAILTGDRSDLGKDIILAFRASGAAHILALSGLHLGVIYMILIKLTSPLGNTPLSGKIKFIFIILSCGYYSIMTGAAPSIIRAFLFIIINETLKLAGRRRVPVRVLCAALTVHLAFSPGSIHSVGFQLSYLAMSGIFLLYPFLKDIYPESGIHTFDKFNPMKRIWNAAAMSISCQTFTAPLAWYHFGTFPEYFILTNLIALPLTSAIMVLSVLTISLSMAGICPDLLVRMNDLAVRSLVETLGIISTM